jgi:transposase
VLRLELTLEEQTALEHTFKTTADPRWRDRCQAVLMARRGRQRKAIAQDLGVHRTTVRQWLNRYQQHGLSGLTIQWAPGQPGRIPESFVSTLQQWLKEGFITRHIYKLFWYRDLGEVVASYTPSKTSI